MLSYFGKLIADGSQKDLSKYTDQDIRDTLAFLNQWKVLVKPQIWIIWAATNILLRAELEDRKAKK